MGIFDWFKLPEEKMNEQELVEKIANYMSKKLKTEYYCHGFKKLWDDHGQISFRKYIINSKDVSTLIVVNISHDWIRINIHEGVLNNPTVMILRPIKNHELLYKKGLNIPLNDISNLIARYISENIIDIRWLFVITVDKINKDLENKQLPTYYRNNNPLKSEKN